MAVVHTAGSNDANQESPATSVCCRRGGQDERPEARLGHAGKTEEYYRRATCVSRAIR